MSGVSSAELLLLLVIGLIVLGPKRLPEIANKVGGWVGQARRMTRVMRRQLEEELNLDEFNNIARPKTNAPKISPPIADKSPQVTAAPDPADPAYDDNLPDEEIVADHIPRDDDAYSPLHEKDKE
jgi:sec-independent protein translocase protein TatB